MNDERTVLSVYLSPSERIELEKLAELNKISLSEYMRKNAIDHILSIPAEASKLPDEWYLLAKKHDMPFLDFLQYAISNLDNKPTVITQSDTEEIKQLREEVSRLQTELYTIKSKEPIEPRTTGEFDNLVTQIFNYIAKEGRGRYMTPDRLMAHFNISDASLFQRVATKLVEMEGIEYNMRNGFRIKQMTFKE